MYFPLLILHSWGKKSAAQPQTIYSEVPLQQILYQGQGFLVSHQGEIRV